MLQLIIQKCSNGLHPVYPSSQMQYDWERNIRDMRPQLTQLHNPKNVKAIMVTEKGYAVGMLRELDGRTADYAAAWLFLDAGESISGTELESRLESIYGIFGQTTSYDEEQKARLRKLCENNDTKQYPDQLVTMRGESPKFACRRYGGATGIALHELLDKLNQPAYQQYKVVFLVEDTPDFRVPDSMDDLTGRPIENLATFVLPVIPTRHRVKVDGKKYMPEDSKTYITLDKDKPVSLTIERDRFITLDIMKQPDELETLKLAELDWKLTVTRQFFKIEADQSTTDRQKKTRHGDNEEPSELRGVKISIDEEELKRAVTIGENQKVSVVIEAPQYEKESRNDVYLSDYSENKQLSVKMKKSMLTHVFSLWVGDDWNGDEINFELNGQNVFTESPLKGYKFSGPPNRSENNKMTYRLKYDKTGPFKKTWLWTVAAVLAVVLFAGGLFIGTALDIKQVQRPKQATEQVQKGSAKPQKKASSKPAPETQSTSQGAADANADGAGGTNGAGGAGGAGEPEQQPEQPDRTPPAGQ